MENDTRRRGGIWIIVMRFDSVERELRLQSKKEIGFYQAKTKNDSLDQTNSGDAIICSQRSTTNDVQTRNQKKSD
jgi:hypothetical protein